MGKIKKEILFAVLGLVLAVCILLLKLFVFTEQKKNVEDVILSESISISYPVNADNEKILVSILELFSFSTDSINENITDGGLFSSLKDLDIKIVAQANISDEQYTLLEVKGPTETKRILIKEGTVIDNLLVKKISNKYIVLESNGVEYTIKLFHTKKLNLTN